MKNLYSYLLICLIIVSSFSNSPLYGMGRRQEVETLLKEIGINNDSAGKMTSQLFETLKLMAPEYCEELMVLGNSSGIIIQVIEECFRNNDFPKAELKNHIKQLMRLIDLLSAENAEICAYRNLEAANNFLAELLQTGKEYLQELYESTLNLNALDDIDPSINVIKELKERILALEGLYQEVYNMIPKAEEAVKNAAIIFQRAGGTLENSIEFPEEYSNQSTQESVTIANASINPNATSPSINNSNNHSSYGSIQIIDPTTGGVTACIPTEDNNRF